MSISCGTCAESGEDHALRSAFADLASHTASQGTERPGLRSHSSQDSLESTPSMTDSDGTVPETELVDDEGSVRQQYMLPSPSGSPTPSVASSAISMPSSNTRAQQSSVGPNTPPCAVADNDWLGMACGLPDATDPFAAIGLQFNGPIIAADDGSQGTEYDLLDATNLLAEVGGQFDRPIVAAGTPLVLEL